MATSTSNKDNYLKLAILKNQFESLDQDSTKTTLILHYYDINYALSSSIPGVPHYRKKWLGNTALHFFAKYCSRNIKLLEAMLNVGADVTRKNDRGLTPIHVAYNTNKKKDLINCFLLAHLKFENSKNPTSNDNNLSHLHIACIVKNLEVVKFFLEHGASVNEAISNDSKVFPGFTPLHLAIENGDENMVQLLLEHGANLNLVNSLGISSLHFLVEKQIFFASYTGSRNVREKRLLSNEKMFDMIFKPNEDALNQTDSTGLSQFHVYCTRINSFKSEECMKFLKNGVDINSSLNASSVVWSNYTPLHFAAHCNLNAVVLLTKSGANLMAKDTKGNTPLDICLEILSPANISCIFEAQKDEIGAISFQNGNKLGDVIAAFNSKESLDNYLKTLNGNINNVLPNDSVLWPGSTLLHLAVRLSPGMDRFRVSQCLKHNADIRIQDANNMTAFHLAFRLERKRCVLDIMCAHRHFTANPVDNENLSHSHILCSAYNGSTKRIVEIFLDGQANSTDAVNQAMPTSTSFECVVSHSGIVKNVVIPAGSRPLHIAIAINNENLTRLLINHDARPHFLDADGFTWVHRAFISLNFLSFKMFKPLLWLGQKSLESNPVSPGGLSHFHIACYAANLKAVEALLPQQKNINEPISSEIIKHVQDTCICLGDTPLHLVMKYLDNDSEQIIDLLLNNGADISATNEKGLSPFHDALLQQRSNEKVIERLASEFDKKIDWMDETGLTKLHVACFLKDLTKISKLLESTGEMNSQINLQSPIWPGKTPLDVLIDKKNSKDDDAVKLLLCAILDYIENSIKTDEKASGSAECQKSETMMQRQTFFANQKGLSAFHVSCMGKDIGIVERFLKLGADINAPKDCFASANAGYSPLHFAVKYGSKDVFELLIKRGANTNQEEINGYTAAYLAAVYDPEKIEIFSRYEKIDISKKNSFGQTILDLLLNCDGISSTSYLYLLNDGIGMENLKWTKKVNLVKTFKLMFDVPTCNSLFKYIPDFEDDQGRNIIHYICQLHFSDYHETASNIEVFIENGSNIDHQNAAGRSPLHTAVFYQFRNNVKALLSLGADINIKDNQGQTPYMLCSMAINERDVETMSKVFYNHIAKLKVLDLYVDPENEKCYEEGTNSFTKSDLQKLNIMNRKRLGIDHKAITLRTYLTEKVVRKFTVMPLPQQRDILKLLEENRLQNFFLEWLALFKTTYIRILERKKSYDLAFDALCALLDPRLPQHILEYISIHLEIQDLENLIELNKL